MTTVQQTGSIDLAAQNGAAKTATNYMSFDSTNGLKIAQSGPSNATKLIQITPSDGILIKDDASNYAKVNYKGLTVFQDGLLIASFNGTSSQIGPDYGGHSIISSDGMEIFTTNTSDSIASFGATSRIGKQYVPGALHNESHVELDYHSLQMIDKDGETYFHVSDLRDAYGRITDVFEGDGSTTVFTTSIPFNGSPIVKVNGTTFTNYTIDSVIVNRLIFGTAPANGSEITIQYEPTTNHTKAYTLGKRDESAYVGLYSVAEGYNVAVSGLYSHAEGYNTKARFAYSHAEGCYTEATASSTHAEGYRTIASGEYSHASGYRTKASSKSQTVIGEYNVEDYAQIHQSGKYAFIIGNGTADNARSNALAVDWNGGIYSQAMAGVIQMFAGSTAPEGWLVCDGSAVSRTTYATLFAAIGTTWGTGDGSTTFNLPDLRGRAPIGSGTGSGLTARTLGSKGGSEALQSHDHAAASNGYNVPGKDGGWNWRNTASGSNTNYKNTPMGGSTAGVASITRTGSTGGGNAGNMQPFAVVNFIICTGKTS